MSLVFIVFFIIYLFFNRIQGAETRTTRDWVVVDTTVAKAEVLLGCNIVYYQQRFSNQLIMRALGDYHIPDDIAGVVDFVAGLHGFPYSSWKPSTYSGNDRIGGNTPTTVNDLYQITVPSGPCNCNSSQAVVEFSGANYSPSDLQTFFKDFAPQLEP